MNRVEKLLEELSPFWQKYVQEHYISVKKDEAVKIMETAEAHGLGVELWEYIDKTCIQIVSKDTEMNGFYVRLFKDDNEIETRFGDAKTKKDIDELIKLVDVMQIIINQLGESTIRG